MVRVYDERFRERFGPMHPRVKELFERFVPCGDPHFGFLRWKCCESDCHSKDQRVVPFSCKGRGLCPSCCQKRAILWAERMLEEVLPDVPYAQLVFTIPKMLSAPFHKFWCNRFQRWFRPSRSDGHFVFQAPFRQTV